MKKTNTTYILSDKRNNNGSTIEAIKRGIIEILLEKYKPNESFFAIEPAKNDQGKTLAS